jgi:hypothetical protein
MNGLVIASLLLVSPMARAATPDASRIPMERALELHEGLGPQGLEIIAGHSFVVSLPSPGSAYFVSTRAIDEHQLPRVVFRVLDAQG